MIVKDRKKMHLICGNTEIHTPNIRIKTESKEFQVYELADDMGIAIYLYEGGAKSEAYIEELKDGIVLIRSKSDYEQLKNYPEITINETRTYEHDPEYIQYRIDKTLKELEEQKQYESATK